MKRGILMIALTMIMGLSLTAQITPLFCNSIADNACVGSCNTFDKMGFIVPPLVTIPAVVCVDVANYNLCPSHVAGAVVFINGVKVDRFKVEPGLTRSYSVSPGDRVVVRMGIKLINPSIACPILGDVNVNLLY